MRLYLSAKDGGFHNNIIQAANYKHQGLQHFAVHVQHYSHVEPLWLYLYKLIVAHPVSELELEKTVVRLQTWHWLPRNKYYYCHRRVDYHFVVFSLSVNGALTSA